MAGIDSDVKLMLHMNGTDGSTVFTDDSYSAHTMTANGDAQIDTAQYKFGEASGLFDGVGDYVSAPDSDDWAFGADDFTIDLWVRITSRTSTVGIWSQVVDASNRINLLLNTSNYLIFNAFSGGSTQAYYYCTWNPTLDTWYHLAIVRDGGVIKMFINGVLQTATESTAIGTTSLADLAAPFCVGRAHDGTDYRYLDGWMDEVRVSKGVARWVSDFAIPSEEYSDAPIIGIDEYTKLMLHNNLSGGKTFTDSSSSAHNVTGEGDAALTTVQKKFGDASLVLDGTNDDLVVASSTDFDFGTGDFTLDCWCRRTTTDSGGDTIFSRYLSSNNQLFLDVNLGKFRFFFQNAGVGVIITGTTTLAIDTWYHVAVVRTGSTWKLFVNGTQEGGDQTSTESVNNLTGQDFYIGGWSGGSLYKFEGYLDEVRISDSARWTAGFTVPSAEYSSDANTKLLLHLNGGATTFVDDSFSPHTVTANGDAQIDSSQYKFGGASGKFDGTGDYLTVLDSDDWYHSGDFTWDCWVRFNGTPTSAVFIAQYQDASNLLRFDYNTTNGLEFSIYSGGVWVLDMYRAWTPSADTWHHVAVVRSGSTWYLFADGLQLGTTATYAGYPNLAGSLYIGQVGDGTNYFNGWIDEVRISNGIARWTADFTVPTEEYSALAVLLNKRERHRIARPIDRIPSDVLVW